MAYTRTAKNNINDRRQGNYYQKEFHYIAGIRPQDINANNGYNLTRAASIHSFIDQNISMKTQKTIEFQLGIIASAFSSLRSVWRKEWR